MRPFKNGAMKQHFSGMVTIALLLALTSPRMLQASADTVLPEGTKISLQLNNPLSTKANNEGDSFTAVVVSPVYLGDRIVIPKGSQVSGSVSRIIRPGRFKGKAVMNLIFRSINIPGRGQLPIIASLLRVDSEEYAAVRSEGAVEREGSPGGDVGKIMAPGIAGAGIGTLAGGRKGAAIGAGVGAAIGLTSVFATRGKDLQVRRGSTMEIVLDKPLAVPLQ